MAFAISESDGSALTVHLQMKTHLPRPGGAGKTSGTAGYELIVFHDQLP